MPRLYEEAALLLCYVIRGGLVLNSIIDPRRIVSILALELETTCRESRSDADAANIILDILTKSWLAWHDPLRRDRLIAMIGTFIGNTPTLQALRGLK